MELFTFQNSRAANSDANYNSNQGVNKLAVQVTNIAQKAAQEAKAASEAQNIAGQQASRQVN